MSATSDRAECGMGHARGEGKQGRMDVLMIGFKGIKQLNIGLEFFGLY